MSICVLLASLLLAFFCKFSHHVRPWSDSSFSLVCIYTRHLFGRKRGLEALWGDGFSQQLQNSFQQTHRHAGKKKKKNSPVSQPVVVTSPLLRSVTTLLSQRLGGGKMHHVSVSSKQWYFLLLVTKKKIFM